MTEVRFCDCCESRFADGESYELRIISRQTAGAAEQQSLYAAKIRYCNACVRDEDAFLDELHD